MISGGKSSATSCPRGAAQLRVAVPSLAADDRVWQRVLTMPLADGPYSPTAGHSKPKQLSHP
jgi:hypothetical protein